jgi:hypothetical protein
MALMVVSSTLMLVLNIFVFVPFGVYQGNLEEFEVGFLQMLLSHWNILVVVWLVLLTPLVLPVKIARLYGVLIFALACFTWLQSALLMWEYGVFDGRGLNFAPFQQFGMLDLAVLVVFLLGALIYSSRIIPVINTVAAIFIIGQFGLMLNDAKDREGIWNREPVRLEIPEAIGALSRENNIFHFVFDSAQSDVFLELVDEANLRDTFAGFTLFLENAAVAQDTAFGIPSTFSGKLFDGSQSPEKYYSDAVENGFHKQLLEAGYVVNLIPLLSMEKGPYTHYFQIPSAYKGTLQDQLQLNTTKLIDVALFRVAPHFLRISIYDDGNWFVSQMIRTSQGSRSFLEKTFFKDYIDELNIALDDPAYHFIHFIPPHPPYVTLADGSYAGEVLPNTRVNFSNELRAMVDLVVQFMDKLKALGIYDQSTIIIQGDHGSVVGAIIDGEEIQPCLPRLPALLAIKRPMKSEALTVSGAFTSILDIGPTILNLAGQDTASVFDLDSSTNRRRHYFAYDEKRLDKYWITGSVFDAKSCEKADSRIIEMAGEGYEMGSVIEFGIQGGAEGILDYGWGTPLQGHCWSKAKKAALLIQIPDKYLNTDLNLDMRFKPFIDEELLPTQRIGVSVNGIHVSDWTEQTGDFKNRTIHIPANAVDSGTLNIVFELPDAESPRAVEAGADSRKLGIALQSVQLSVSETTKQ